MYTYRFNTTLSITNRVLVYLRLRDASQDASQNKVIQVRRVTSVGGTRGATRPTKTRHKTRLVTDPHFETRHKTGLTIR